jgi:hypothetical protein
MEFVVVELKKKKKKNVFDKMRKAPVHATLPLGNECWAGNASSHTSIAVP